MEFKSFQNPFQFIKWKKSCHLLSRVLYLKIIWTHGDHKCKNESLGKSFYSLSFNFQKGFKFTHFQRINQTISQIYLFIITFQNLEFWDVTNLPPLKWISSSRFEEASKKKVRVWGSPQNPSIITGVLGATTLRSIVTAPSKTHILHPYCWQCRSSHIFRIIPPLGSSNSGITFCLKFSILLSW